MSSPSRLTRWPCFPDIPIILDTDEHGTPLLQESRSQMLRVPQTPSTRFSSDSIRVVSPLQSECPSPRIAVPDKVRIPTRPQPRPSLRSFLDNKPANPESQQSHWDRRRGIQNKTQRQRSAAIVQFSLAGSQVPFGGSSNSEKSVRFSPAGSQVPSGASSNSEKTVQINPESECKTTFGLGIIHQAIKPAVSLPTQEKLAPPLPIKASYEKSAPPLPMKSSHERNESTQNIAQRIEKRLWQYSSSGNVVKRWLLEIISWIISALCMGTIIGILLYYQNDKLPRIPGGLTLNAIIAVLSKVASAALLLPASEALGQLKWSWFQGDSKKMWDFEIFDNASRGPWGSFLLLIRTKGKTLAALGAAVTLLSLALDPFFQQVVTFPDRWTLQGRSSITIATHYSPNVGKQLVAGKRIIPQDADFTAVATKFFYDNGTESVPFGNGTRADIPLSCPTSNCTWPAYETLGVCSACEDVSQLLTFSCLTTRLEWIANLTGPGANVIYPNGTVCGYFFNATSAKPMLMSGYRVDTNDSTGGEALLMRALPLITNPSRLPLFGGSINFKHVRNPIADFVIASAADGSASVYRNETPVAHECVLSWCVKTIRSSYYWANYNEDVIEKFINNTAGPYPWVPVKSGSTIDIFYPQNITIDAPSNNHNTSNNTREDYGVGNTTAFAAIGVFDEFFPSFLTAANASAEPFLRYRIQQNLLPKSRDLTNNPWRASNNITQHMERLATALTNVVRSSSGKTQVLGTAFSMETYVEVRWEWLALPLAVLLLSLVFLASTVMKSSREKDRVGVWKTSALATLLYGLPDDMQKKITSSTAVGTPRAKAKELKIKMLPKFGWRISGNIFSPMPPKVKPNPPPPGWI